MPGARCDRSRFFCVCDEQGEVNDNKSRQCQIQKTKQFITRQLSLRVSSCQQVTDKIVCFFITCCNVNIALKTLAFGYAERAWEEVFKFQLVLWMSHTTSSSNTSTYGFLNKSVHLVSDLMIWKNLCNKSLSSKNVLSAARVTKDRLAFEVTDGNRNKA